MNGANQLIISVSSTSTNHMHACQSPKRDTLTMAREDEINTNATINYSLRKQFKRTTTFRGKHPKYI